MAAAVDGVASLQEDDAVNGAETGSFSLNLLSPVPRTPPKLSPAARAPAPGPTKIQVNLRPALARPLPRPPASEAWAEMSTADRMDGSPRDVLSFDWWDMRAGIQELLKLYFITTDGHRYT